MSMQEYDVVVVGAGLVGLACATALAKEGFRLALIEASDIFSELPQFDAPFDPKVVAITRASQDLLEQLGVWASLPAERLCAYQRMRVWDSTSDGNIEFTADALFEPNLGHIVENQVLQAQLQKTLHHYEITFLSGLKITNTIFNPEHVKIALSSGQHLISKLIIAADGANSKMREMMQISSTQWDYQQSALVAVVQGELSHEQTAFQRFAPCGPLALLPLAHPLQSVVVWSTAPDKAQQLYQNTMPAFNEELTRESQAVMGNLQLISKRFIFPLRTHHAKQYAISRGVLVGDAAHTLHPLAGQGVNLGFLDVAALVKNLVQAKKKQRDFGHLSLLRRYERERKMHNQIMIWAMEFFKRGFGAQVPIIQQLRNVGLNWVDRHQPLKQFFAKIALGSQPPLPWLKRPTSC